MVRLALIAGTYQPDRCGVAHYTAHLRAALAQHGVESMVLTTHRAATTGDRSVWGVVSDWHIPDLVGLVRAIHATQADLLHIQHAAGTYGFDRAIFLLPLLLRLTGWTAPIVTTAHEYGWWEWQPGWIPQGWLEWLKTWGQQQGWWDREDGFLLTQSHAIITTNRNAETVIRSRLPNLPQPIYQIPIAANIEVAPIDRHTARQKILTACNWTGDVAIVAFFGFLHPVKGLETLLSAFVQVLTRHPHARLLLIGGVESLALQDHHAYTYWQQLQQAIVNLGLTGKVHLTGYVDSQLASHYLTGADVGVLPFNPGVTLKSGSLLAMLAHSLPVIATRSDPADIELETALVAQLIPPCNVAELAIALNHLLSHPEWRSQLGNAGRNFSHRFTWSEITRAHLDIYRTVLAPTPVVV